VSRLGEEEATTHKTEKLHVLHSLAVSLGCKEDILHTTSVSVPTKLDALEEFVGLSYKLPDLFEETEAQDDEGAVETNEEQAAQDLASFLHGIDWEEEDVAVDPNQFANLVEDDTALQEKEVSDCAWTMATHLFSKETTMDSFRRLTSDQPWIPFEKPDKPKEKCHEEECSLFESMCKRFDHHAGDLKSVKGYTAFSRQWDVEVANRHKAKFTDSSVVLICWKSAVQLQQHYDEL